MNPITTTPWRSETARAEIDAQAEILLREFAERTILTLIAFGLCTIYVEGWLIALLATINIGTDMLNHVIMRDARRRHAPFYYRVQLVLFAVSEAGFAAAAGLVWLVDDPYSKALAVGLVMTALLHLTVMRAIHLPTGLTGLAMVAITVAVFNTIYWMDKGQPVGLALSATSAFCALAYAFIAMLSNHRLHRAMREEEERASRADQAKSRFLAVLSHELRTPLNSVLGMAHTAWGEAEEPALRDKLGVLVASAGDLATLLDDATDMSAIEDGRLRLRDRPVDLLAELEAAIGPFRPQAARQRSTLGFRADPALPRHLNLDPQRLRQCLVNLLGNALKHAGEGPVEVTAGPARGGFEVIVADHGPGISPIEAEQVFEPFRRGRTGAQGSGLGLTICRALARQMGGDVKLLPPDGRTGARFRLWLPCRPADETAPAPPTGLPDIPGRTILIVDDIGTNRLVAGMHLRPSRARVLEAESGARALDILTEDQVDLVLLDLNMPGMDGAETVARIRALGGRHARVPVVAMTADATLADGTALGMDGLIVKPLDPGRLAAELWRHFPD